MDIEEMKKNWGELNDRLQKNEIVNTEAIKKLLASKARGSYDKLRNREKMGTLAGCFVCIMFIIMFLAGRMQHWYSFVLLEGISLIATGYGFYSFKSLPRWDQSRRGLADMMHATSQYKKLQAFNRPILLGAMAVAIVIFFCFENKGFDSEPKYQVIFWFTIGLIIWCGTSGLRLVKRQITEADEDILELKKFEKE